MPEIDKTVVNFPPILFHWIIGRNLQSPSKPLQTFQHIPSEPEVQTLEEMVKQELPTEG